MNTDEQFMELVERMTIALERLVEHKPHMFRHGDSELVELLPPRYRPRGSEIIAIVKRHRENDFRIVRSLKAAGIISEATNRKHVNLYHAIQQEICKC